MLMSGFEFMGYCSDFAFHPWKVRCRPLQRRSIAHQPCEPTPHTYDRPQPSANPLHTCIPTAQNRNRYRMTNPGVGRGTVYLCKDPAVRVTRYHLNCVVGKLEHLGLFENDDTAGFDGLLHRVGVMRDKVRYQSHISLFGRAVYRNQYSR